MWCQDGILVSAFPADRLAGVLRVEQVYYLAHDQNVAFCCVSAIRSTLGSLIESQQVFRFSDDFSSFTSHGLLGARGAVFAVCGVPAVVAPATVPVSSCVIVAGDTAKASARARTGSVT